MLFLSKKSFSKQNFDLKKFRSKKIWVRKKLGSISLLGPNNFWAENKKNGSKTFVWPKNKKKSGPKIFWWPKYFLDPNLFWLENFHFSLKFYWSIIIFRSKKMLCQKILGPKELTRGVGVIVGRRWGVGRVYQSLCQIYDFCFLKLVNYGSISE